jgi:hypothetical protein
MHKQRISNLDDTICVDVDLLCGQGFMGEFIDIERVKGMTTAVEDAPQLILLGELPGSGGSPLAEVILDGLEGQLTDDLEFKGGGAHELVDNLAVLNEF